MLPALGAAAPVRNLRFEQLSLDQGLSQESVNAIVQDSRGFIWLGTQTGLNRYDGYRVAVYINDPNDPRSLSDNFVLALCEDRNTLWIGSHGGLDRYDPASNTFVREAAAKSEVDAIVADGRGGLWLGLADGLGHYVPSTGQLTRDTSIGHVSAIMRDLYGDLWIGSASGVYRIARAATTIERQVSAADRAREPARYAIRALAADRTRLWIASDAGVEAWSLNNPAERHRFTAADGMDTTRANALLVDRDGIVWMGSDDGLLWWNAALGRFDRYRHHPDSPRSLADDRVVCLYQDRAGVLWAGTWYGGASRVDLTSGFERFRHYSDEPASLSDSRATGVLLGGAVLWVSTLNGLNRLDALTGLATAVFQHDPDRPSSISDSRVTAVTKDAAGRYWVGTFDGVNRFDPATGVFSAVRFSAVDKSSNQVEVIYEDRAGTLWIGTQGGLHRMDLATGAIRTFRHAKGDPHSLANDLVKAIVEDRDGTLWVGTFDGGLDRLSRDTGRFTHLRHDPNDARSLSHDRVHCLYSDRAGTLWVGTAVGFNRVERQPDGAVTFQPYTRRDGLVADAIGGIQEDSAGRLWISTSSGISRFHPPTGRFRNYTARDGLIDGAYFVGMSYRDSAGTIYFGGFNGLTAFVPEAIRDNRTPPEVAITEVRVFNEPVPYGDSLTLSYRQSVFSFEFVAMHAADPQRNRYAHRLDGFDRDWVYTDASQRFATYTNLEPGRYVFRVKAANKDDVWNETGAALTVTITPPFWKTTWFRAVAVVLLAGVAFGGYHLQVRRLVRRAETRALEEMSLTDPLTGLRNRRFLEQHLESDVMLTARQHDAALRAGAPPPAGSDLLFFLVDLDHFKAVNDRYGHAAGDRVLRQMRARLQTVFRDSDYVVRWGGEEFLAIARGSSRADADAMAERIRVSVSRHPFEVDGGVHVALTCSVGYASYPFVPAQPRLVAWPDVVDLADHGLYCAKRGGRNVWVGVVATDATHPDDLTDTSALTFGPTSGVLKDA